MTESATFKVPAGTGQHFVNAGAVTREPQENEQCGEKVFAPFLILYKLLFHLLREEKPT